MRYADAVAFRRALEQRIKNHAQQSNVSIARLRKQVAFDQLLRRLTDANVDSWLLKGAVALDYRFGTAARSTNDLDLFWNGPSDEVVQSIESAERVEVDYHFKVTFERTTKLDGAEDFAAVRYRAYTELANRRFEAVVIDTGFDGDVIGAPEPLNGPDLLTFADIDPVQIKALSLSQHVAEKTHAYARIYARSRPSSRVKDLVDLVIIGSLATFRAEELRVAIQKTFEHRGGGSPPDRMIYPPSSWADGYRRLAREVGIHPDVTVGYTFAASFLDPILDGSVSDHAVWRPAVGGWQA